MDISIPLGPVVELLGRLLRVNAITASTGKVTERLRKSICEFQLEYTNYQFSSSRLHKLFKEADDEKKGELYNDMNDLLEAGLKSVFGSLAAQIQNYFIETHNSSSPPRVGVHLVTDENEIINVIQLPAPNGGKIPPKRMKDYTVLEEIFNTGRPYIENNIPRRILKDTEYKHKGLNTAKTRKEYKTNLMDIKIISRWRNNFRKKPRKDKKWKDIAIGKSGHSFIYKSHIFVPITYRRHAEKSSMNKEMIRVLQLEDDGRSILGFLSVDHPDTYYFHDADPQHYDNIDINSLVVFADMLSLVIVTKLMYTSGSTTVKNYIEHREAKYGS